MQQFKTEIFLENQGRFYDIKSLGNANTEYQKTVNYQYGKNSTKKNTRCESQHCELDLPGLHAVCKGLSVHEAGTMRWAGNKLSALKPFLCFMGL